MTSPRDGRCRGHAPLLGGHVAVARFTASKTASALRRGDSVALPPLTPEQRTAALEKAAIARRERAEVKNRLKHAGRR